MRVKAIKRAVAILSISGFLASGIVFGSPITVAACGQSYVRPSSGVVTDTVAINNSVGYIHLWMGTLYDSCTNKWNNNFQMWYTGFGGARIPIQFYGYVRLWVNGTYQGTWQQNGTGSLFMETFWFSPGPFGSFGVDDNGSFAYYPSMNPLTAGGYINLQCKVWTIC